MTMMSVSGNQWLSLIREQIYLNRVSISCLCWASALVYHCCLTLSQTDTQSLKIQMGSKLFGTWDNPKIHPGKIYKTRAKDVTHQLHAACQRSLMCHRPVVMISSGSNETQAEHGKRECRQRPGGYSVAKPLNYLTKEVGTRHVSEEASCGRFKGLQVTTCTRDQEMRRVRLCRTCRNSVNHLTWFTQVTQDRITVDSDGHPSVKE